MLTYEQVKPEDTKNGYDYKNQAWVINGKYFPCGHAGTKWDCDCYGRKHAGEPVAADAEIE